MKEKSVSIWLIVLVALAGGFFGGALSMNLDLSLEEIDPKPVPQTVYLEESELISVIEKVSPAVVSVIGEKEFGLNGVIAVGEGTGFVVREDGLILTNKHVVLDEEADYKVVFDDGEEYEVEVLGRDPFDDIAVLKISAEGQWPVIKLSESEELKVGQRVIAFGNALAQYENTVTYGIISGLSRNVAAFNDAVARAENLSGLIQTDAAINPGNSGGPLLNLDGEVVGMNVAVARAANGIGFAIPSVDLLPVLASVEEYGKIVRPVLGVRFVMLSDDEALEMMKDFDYGALVVAGAQVSETALVAGGPAEKAGVKDRDVILAVNEEEVSVERPLQKIIRDFAPGDEVVLKVWREGKVLELKVELEIR